MRRSPSVRVVPAAGGGQKRSRIGLSEIDTADGTDGAEQCRNVPERRRTALMGQNSNQKPQEGQQGRIVRM